MTRKTLRKAVRTSYAVARRVATLVVGGTVVLIGVALIALPGPAVVVIPAGLAILALEFAWARRLLERAKEGASNGLRAARSYRSNAEPEGSAPAGSAGEVPARDP
jgi:uncharacterized protein (TIGR02611 family)